MHVSNQRMSGNFVFSFIKMNWTFAFCMKERVQVGGAGYYVNFHHIGPHKWDRGLGQTFLGQSFRKRKLDQKEQILKTFNFQHQRLKLESCRNLCVRVSLVGDKKKWEIVPPPQ